MQTLAKRITPVSLVAGGEGFGKIAAVARMASDDAPVVYFTPRAEQRSLFDRVFGFVEAIAGLAPGLKTSFAGAAEYSRQAAQPHEELALWVTRHLAEVRARIVLVNIDRVNDDGFIDFIRAVIEASEPTVEWICIARSAPALPWDVWKTYGVFDRAVTESDLRLKRADATALAREAGVPAATADALYKMTAGWPLGFKAALRLSQAQRQAVLAEAADAAELYDRAARSLFGDLAPELQDALVQCSVVDEFDLAFASAAGFEALWPQIAAIADDGILLAQMPGGSVRYRDSFRAALHDGLRASGADALNRARVAAGMAYESSGRIIVALSLYSAWNLADEILRVCGSNGFSLLEAGHAASVHTALATVPEAAKKEHAVALAVIAMQETVAGRYDIAEAWFLQAIAAAHSPDERASITYRYVLELMRHGHAEVAELLESYADAQELAADLRSAIRSTLAIAYVLTQRFAEAQAMMESAIAEAERDGASVVLASVLQHAAWAQLFTGDVQAARQTAERAVHTALSCSLYDCAARAYTVLYNVAYDIDDDPVASAAILENVLECATKAGSAPLRLFALLGMLDLATERGDAQDLQRIERALASYEISYGDPMTSAALVSAQALFLAGNGRFGEAYDVLSPSAERQVTPDRRALRFSEMALYAAAAQRPREAADALSHIEALEPDLKHDRRMLRALANVVLAYMLLGNQSRAEEIQAKLAQEADAMGSRGRAFADAVDAVARRWNGAENRAILQRRFDALTPRNLGGFSAVLTALPLRPDNSKTSGKRTRDARGLSAMLNEHRETIVANALGAPARGVQTLLADLVAAATVERVGIWLQDRNDRDVIDWAEQTLLRRHNGFIAAHVFGDTIAACASFLRRERVIDEPADADLAHLRESLDMHLSALQVRGSLGLADPDPADAEIFNLLERMNRIDPTTHEHSKCVGAWCARLAKRMHLTKADAHLVMRCGLMHDVGKLLTPIEILQAPRRLSDEEWNIMRRHTLDGVRILEPVPRLRVFIPAVRWHHERFDGKGYPDEIALQDIPFAARIVAVADGFNAMIARRPYREPLPPMVAVEELKKYSGTQFDPAVVAGMIDVVLRPDP